MTARWTLFTVLATASLVAQVKLPPYTHQVLANGVVIDLMPRPGVPLVQFRILVKGGSEADPPQLSGLAGITAQLLRKGTAKRTADQFSEELDFLGGSFNAGDGGQAPATAIFGEFLRKDFDRGLDLISDAAFHPTFPEAEVKKILSQRVDAAKAVKDNPGASIGFYFQVAFFGPGHPYGHPANENTLARIQRQNIVDFHARNYCGSNIIVIVSGDFDSAEAASKIREAFADLPAGKTIEWAKPTTASTATKLVLVDKPDATQTYFYIGQPGIDRRNPDRVKLMLINTLFGGRFTSMLNEALRVQTGLTYGASSQFQQSRLPGSIVITTYTKTETTAKAIDLALDILKKLGEKGITAEQLASVKAYIKGTFPTTRLETPDQLASILSEMELYGLGRAEVDDFFSQIDAVSLADANAAAKRYYKSDNLTFVLVGNAAKIRESVAKYAPNLTEIQITNPGFGVAY
jgi:zinc protease